MNPAAAPFVETSAVRNNDPFSERELTMKQIRTVLGSISPEDLGFTSMHDHTVIDMRTAADYLKSLFPPVPPEMVEFRMENMSFFRTGAFLMCPEMQKTDDVDGLAAEYGFFKAMGGQSVVDPSPKLIRGDIRKIQELSRRTGLNIICATGMYHQTAVPQEYWDQGTDYYYGLFSDEINNGIDGTEVRPGILKASLATCCEMERDILEACIRLSSETGMAVYIHTEPTTDGGTLHQYLDTLCGKYGVDHGRIQVCHMDSRIACGVPVAEYMNDPAVNRTLDVELHKRLLGEGYTIGLDCWGMPTSGMYLFIPDNYERLKALITLLDLGYGSQIVLGNDFSSRMLWKKYGGSGSVSFIESGLAGLEMFGRKDQIQKLVVENPARILAF